MGPSERGYYEERPASFVALVEPRFRTEVRELLLDPKRVSGEAGVDED